MSGYFGDSGNKDFMQNWNKGMEELISHSVMKIKLNSWDFKCQILWVYKEP